MKIYAFILYIFLSLATILQAQAKEPYAEKEILVQEQAFILVTVKNPESPILNAVNSSGKLKYNAYNIFNPSASLKTLSKDLEKKYHVKLVNEWPIVPLGIYCYVYKVDTTKKQSIIKKLGQDKRVETVQVMNTFETLSKGSVTSATNIHNDPYAGLQKNFQAMNIYSVHNSSKGGKIKLAIVDTVLEKSHPDFLASKIKEFHFLDSDKSQNTFHGTAVAGVITAIPNNQKGIAGIAPESKILSLQGCWHNDISSTKAQCNTLTLSQAISYAIDKGSDIINLSLTGPMDPLLKRLVEHAIKKNIIIVAADEKPNSNIDYFPADIDGVISVNDKNVTKSEKLMLGFSNNEILTTTPKGRYDFVKGSSLSTAQISGLISLGLSLNKDLSNTDIYQALLDSKKKGDSKSINSYIDGCLFLDNILKINPNKNTQNNACKQI